MSNPTRRELMLYDETGKEHRAYMLTNWRDVTNSDSDGTREKIPTTIECRLESGSNLRFIDDNTFETESGKLLYRKPTSK